MLLGISTHSTTMLVADIILELIHHCAFTVHVLRTRRASFSYFTWKTRYIKKSSHALSDTMA